jgi:hypothetical protein
MEDFRVKGGTLTSNFEHKYFLEDFFTDPEFWRYHKGNEDVYKVFKQIEVNGAAEGDFWDTLKFFNFLYEQLDIIVHHPNRPLEIIEHLKSLEIDSLQLHVLLKSLHKLRFVFSPLTLSMLDKFKIDFRTERLHNNWLRVCVDIIQGEFGVLPEGGSGRPAKFVFDFKEILKISDVNKDSDETINNLIMWINCYEQQVSHHPDMFFNDGGNFIKRCEIKIRDIRKSKAGRADDKFKQPKVHEDLLSKEEPKEQIIRPRQAVLALYYYYLQEVGEFPRFENMDGGKQKAVTREAEKYRMSGKKLEAYYNIIDKSRTNRVAFNQVKNIEEVIIMLQSHPKARSLAIDELEIAKKFKE